MIAMCWCAHWIGMWNGAIIVIIALLHSPHTLDRAQHSVWMRRRVRMSKAEGRPTWFVSIKYNLWLAIASYHSCSYVGNGFDRPSAMWKRMNCRWRGYRAYERNQTNSQRCLFCVATALCACVWDHSALPWEHELRTCVLLLYCCFFAPFWCSFEFVPKSVHIVIAIRHLQEQSHFFCAASLLFFCGPDSRSFLTIQSNLFHEYFLMSFAPMIFSLAIRRRSQMREIRSLLTLTQTRMNMPGFWSNMRGQLAALCLPSSPVHSWNNIRI